MKLFILKALNSGPRSNWAKTYDCVYGLIVNAENEFDARILANTAHSDEGAVWTDYSQTSCQELKSSSKQEIIMVDDLNG